VSDPLPTATQRVVLDRDGVRIHTFTAPEAFLANSTHIIETRDLLVVIDGQFVVPYARQFRAYADALGKPIDRVYLSHAHVDHFFGIGAAFADVPVYAPAETIDWLQANGEATRAERAQQYGPLVPARIVVPNNVAAPGTDVVDGVKYELEVMARAECDAQLVLRLPDLGVTVAQDLIYSGAHPYVTRDTASWITVLQGLAESPSELFLAGHGPVADRAEVRRTIDYLITAQRAFAANTDPRKYQAELIAAYPDRTGTAIFDIYLPRLYVSQT
jgi:glyoxylase-like metal-dependent hydrolase (beta-lactamase superfamily II)